MNTVKFEYRTGYLRKDCKFMSLNHLPLTLPKQRILKLLLPQEPTHFILRLPSVTVQKTPRKEHYSLYSRTTQLFTNKDLVQNHANPDSKGSCVQEMKQGFQSTCNRGPMTILQNTIHIAPI